MEQTGVMGSFDVYETTLPLDTAGIYWYHFRVEAGSGQEITVPGQLSDGEYQITVYTPAETGPDWIEGGLFYHVFVDRFYKSGKCTPRPGAVVRDDWGGTPYYKPDAEGIMHNNDFFGGDLYGVVEKLPYLVELGVTCIYLSPVFEAASNHKYDTGDYKKVDDAFGGDEALETLCQRAKAHGIRVILDGVFSHVGIDSRYFNRYGRYPEVGAYQSLDSPYHHWFHFKEWPDDYEAWWGIELLPAINKSSESYRDFITGPDGVIAHWAKHGVSGWRLDVVDELPDIFLDPLCQAMKREDPEALIIGEVWEDASNKIAYGYRRRYFQGGQLDSVMNYPLKNAIISFVREGNAEGLAARMATLVQNYPAPVLHKLMNILGTHDTMRILTVLGGENIPHTRDEMEHFRLTADQMQLAKARLKLAATLQYTLPGTPCIYYGDEAGMEGGADPFCRRCYPWGKEDQNLLTYYRKLGGLRREHPVLARGAYALQKAHGGVFAFTRGTGDEALCVTVNHNTCEATIYKNNQLIIHSGRDC